VAVLQKLDIHSKEAHEKAARTSHEKQHISQNFTVQYKCNEQNTRYNKLNTRYKTQKNKQNPEKQQHTQKQQNTKTRKKLLPGIEPGPSSL
jgi:hypothetical protein